MRLYVNIDHIATIREARRTDEPDPVEAAAACLAGGADGITVHLREDRRHIQDHDVRRLAEAIDRPINLELATAEDILSLAIELRPHQATFVPERREEITTEGGLRLRKDGRLDPQLADAVQRLKSAGIRVSLFIDPDLQSIDDSAALQVEAIELHTGEYANTYRDSDAALERLRRGAASGRAAGLAVHAGHGLTTSNVTPVAAIPEVEELNIGHHIVSRSVIVGMKPAVAEMRERIAAARVDRGRA